MNKKDSTLMIAEQILKAKKKPMDVQTLFAEVAKVKEFTEEEKNDSIGQFYTYLTVDGRFIILSDGTWDLRDNHPYDLVNTISTDFDLFDDENEDEEDDDYEALEVIVVTDEEEIEKEKKNIKDLIGYEESDEL